MWVVVGEEKWDRETWERYHKMEMEDGLRDVMRCGWLYEETYEKYCEEFDKAKGELFSGVEEVSRIRKRLYEMPYGKDWEEECDYYSDYHKDIYGWRPRDIGEILRCKGISREMREAMWEKMDEERKAEWEKAKETTGV